MNNKDFNLKSYVQEARSKKVAIGHFNVSNLEMFHGVWNAASKLQVPVIIGVSEGERDFMGIAEVIALVRTLREKYNYPIFINADHTYSFERVKEAIDAGFDSAIFDGTELPLEENIATTKKCVEYAKSINSNILLEAEVGFIGKSSKLLDKVPDGVGRVTTVEEANDFINQTKIDMLAPAVGNVHGMVKGGEPKLDTQRIKEIVDATGVPLVLHGASGNSVEDVKASIEAGISIVHISTEIRVAYIEALKKSLSDNPKEIAPYRYLNPTIEAVEKVVTEKLKLFNNIV